LLSGEFEDGDSIIVDVIDGEIKLHKAEEQLSPPSETVEVV